MAGRRPQSRHYGVLGFCENWAGTKHEGLTNADEHGKRKLREVAAAFAGNGLVYPSGLRKSMPKLGQVAWPIFSSGLADELEQRSLSLAGFSGVWRVTEWERSSKISA